MIPKYCIHVIKTTFQEEAAYPVRILSRVLRNGILVILFAFLWTAIFQNTKEIGGYTLGSMIIYYAVNHSLKPLTFSGKSAKQITNGIKEGTLSTFLMKPIKYNLYNFFETLTSKVILSILPLTILFVLVLYYLPNLLNINRLILFIISLLSAILINHLVYSLIGTVGFWTVNTWGIVSVFGRFADILSGAIFPLSILPPSFQTINNFFPFKYMNYTPITIFLGKTSLSESLIQISIQLLWVIILYFSFKFLWKRGLNKYESVGI